MVFDLSKFENLMFFMMFFSCRYEEFFVMRQSVPHRVHNLILPFARVCDEFGQEFISICEFFFFKLSSFGEEGNELSANGGEERCG
mgnify:FL=1